MTIVIAPFNIILKLAYIARCSEKLASSPPKFGSAAREMTFLTPTVSGMSTVNQFSSFYHEFREMGYSLDTKQVLL